MAHYRIVQIEDYEPLVGREPVERIRQKAAKLKGPAGSQISIPPTTAAAWQK